MTTSFQAPDKIVKKIDAFAKAHKTSKTAVILRAIEEMATDEERTKLQGYYERVTSNVEGFRQRQLELASWAFGLSQIIGGLFKAGELGEKAFTALYNAMGAYPGQIAELGLPAETLQMTAEMRELEPVPWTK